MISSEIDREGYLNPQIILYIPTRQMQTSMKIDEIQIPSTGIDLDELTKVLIRKAIDMKGGKKVHAAKMLGMSGATLLYRIKKCGMNV